MKRVLIVLLVLLMCFSFAACRKTIEERAAEKILEGVLDADVDIENGGEDFSISTSDGEVDFSINSDGEGVTIEGDDGKIETGSDLAYPTSHMGDLPELNARIEFVSTMDEPNISASVTYADITMEAAKNYLNVIKSLGYEGMEFADDTEITFIGSNAKGEGVAMTYADEDKVMLVSFTGVE